ncbi:SH3 domain-containing protein [Glutamicibacter creatinolyticus]|uniref:SH3 domain-containing protein n=1 Tax=Glutamicibacter creatinolyticus TaxID=162496 RepID=UPI0037BFD61E
MNTQNKNSSALMRKLAQATVALSVGGIVLAGCTSATGSNALAGSLISANTTGFTAADNLSKTIDPAETTPRKVDWAKEATQDLQLRQFASDDASSLATIPADTALQVTDSAGRWAKVAYKSKTGWVPSGYLRDIDARKVNWSKKTERAMELRTAPDDTAPSVKSLEANAPVTVTNSYGRWAKVNASGTAGWVPAGWLSDAKNSRSNPSPSPAPAPQPEAKPKPETNKNDTQDIDKSVLNKWGTPDLRDEFDYVDAKGNPAIDPDIWNVRGRDTLGLLPDKTVVHKDQVTVDNKGIAHLRADWLADPITASTAPFTRVMHTGYMDMRKLREGDADYAQRYGRWEIRAKVPTKAGTSNGVLAAFWLRNSNSGEIDIMESWGSSPKPPAYQKVGTSTTTVHTQTSGKNNEKEFWVLEPLLGIKEHVANDFHTWALEYTPDRFAMYYDDKLAFETTPAKSPNIWGPSFQSPLHVRLNLHMGMSEKYFGLPDPQKKNETKDSDFQVDYVRIWDMKK